MKIKKSQLTELLKKIIKEELENIQTTSNRQLFEEIQQICQEALTNKSLGIDPKIQKMYKDKILNVINQGDEVPPFVDGVPVTDDMF